MANRRGPVMVINKYAGECQVCRKSVAAGEGVAVKSGNGWAVRHQASRWVGSPVSGKFVGGC